MTEHVDLYIGTKSDLSEKGTELFEKARLVNAESTTAPANMKEHYNVEVTLESKETGVHYKTEIDSRTINNWLTRFSTILEEELKSDEGIEGEYTAPNERNPEIIRVLSRLVPFWINTENAEQIS